MTMPIEFGINRCNIFFYDLKDINTDFEKQNGINVVIKYESINGSEKNLEKKYF